MAVRYVALLLLWLVLLLQMGQPMDDYECKLRFDSTDCIINTNMSLTVSKSRDNKYYQLQLCSNGKCIPRAQDKNWFKCDKVCRVCHSALSPQSCTGKSMIILCKCTHAASTVY